MYALLALLTLSPTAAAADLIVDGTSVTLDGSLTYASVQISNGGTVYVTAYDGSGTTGTLSITADSIEIDATSSIIGTGRGYRGRTDSNGEGPGGGRGGQDPGPAHFPEHLHQRPRHAAPALFSRGGQ